MNSTLLPQIRVMDPHSRDSAPLNPSPAARQPPSSPPSRPQDAAVDTSAPTSDPAVCKLNSGGDADDDASSIDRAPIDPLSQQIFKRINTSQDVLQKLRPMTVDTSSTSRPFTADGSLGANTPRSTSRDETISLASSKKKGVSFLSRFIGNMKKNDGDAPSEYRPEGTNAEPFSQLIDSSIGYRPRYPQPSGYIKVRSKFKKGREFDRVFLAQQLCTNPSGPRHDRKNDTDKRPVWALEFSRDGKYLAAGGHDSVIRVWSVISSPDERIADKVSEADADEDGPAMRLNAPVFQTIPHREYLGHDSTILDVSWSKNNFLLSSSMDKTVRLWHANRNECLCTFKHSDFVPSVQFHPTDDRFFLAGSLDSKLRLWSIPDKTVAFWAPLPEMITAVAFTPDGKTAVAGTLTGLCMLYETDGLKYQAQIHVRSSRGKNAKGSKITGIQAMRVGAGSTAVDDVGLLVSSNDSRIRLYSLRDKGLEIKFQGQENNFSQIRATFSDDAKYVICGSEDRRAYIWSTSLSEGESKTHPPVEMFDAHSDITTCAIMAPTKTRQLLGNSEDPVYDICNPPPVTLVSKAESRSSKHGSEIASVTDKSRLSKKVEGTPAYMARSAHPGGHVIVTADYQGNIKVFRQDCAFGKRKIVNDNWDASSIFSKRTAGSGMRRSTSTKTRASGSVRIDPMTTANAATAGADRILSWRQNISASASIDDGRSVKGGRGVSPSKFSMNSSARTSGAHVAGLDTNRIRESIQPIDALDSSPADKSPDSGPAVSWQTLTNKDSCISRLSSEESAVEEGKGTMECR